MKILLIHFNLRSMCLVLIAIAIVSSAASAQTQVDKTLSPYFVVQGDPNVDHLPLKDTRVEIAVSGVIADVKVLQTYRNEGSRPINASYVFPASTRAAVYSMRMRIGDQIIFAKIKEREAAKQEFEAAKKEGKSASLLEQQRPNVFSMNLANVLPHDQIEIELRYTELLVPTDGIYEVVFPTVVGPRYSSPSESSATKEDQFVKSPYLQQGKKPTSTLHISTKISAGVPIQDLSCASHKVSPVWQNPTTAQLELDDADVFQGNRDFVLRYRLAGEQITSGLLLYQGQDENFFLYMAQPPLRVASEDIPAREYIFVVDVSGSMEGFPLNTSKQLLRDLIGQLRPTDLFNVVLFAGDSTVLSANSLQANQENIAGAIRLLDGQRGSGGTELLPAIQQAMSIPRRGNVSRSIVLVTDGYISGEQGVFDYIRANLDQCNVFSFGIGSAVNRYLLDGVAKAGMGEPFIVTNEAQAPVIAAKFREYIQMPILTDIHIRSINFETYDVHPVRFPDLMAQRPVILFGKWRGPVGGSFELRGKTGRGDYMTSLGVGGVQPDEGNRALRYLWARSRIAELSDYGARNPAEDKVKEITSLGLKYNLLTRYTSFIAVREEVRNPLGPAKDVNQPLPLPLGVSDLAVGDGTESGTEPELVWLVTLSLLVTLIMIFHARRRRLLIADYQVFRVPPRAIFSSLFVRLNMNQRSKRTYIAQLIAVLISALTLKLLYSTASPNQLRWILAPTTFLVEFVSGTSFTFESHAGYLSSDRGFLIAASCAGVNFLITSFLMLTLSKLLRNRTQGVPWRFIPSALLFAYLATLVANTVRISTALRLQQTPLEIGWLNQSQLHRFEGTFIYFGFLLLLFMVSEKMSSRNALTSESAVRFQKALSSDKASRLDIIVRLFRQTLFPLVLYYATTLGIPLANAVASQTSIAAGFWEHSLFVLLTPLLVILPLAAFAVATKRRSTKLHESTLTAALPPSVRKGSAFPSCGI